MRSSPRLIHFSLSWGSIVLSIGLLVIYLFPLVFFLVVLVLAWILMLILNHLFVRSIGHVGASWIIELLAVIVYILILILSLLLTIHH